MSIVPTIHLTAAESKLFADHNEAWMPAWAAEIERLHRDFPDDDIITIALDEHGRHEVVFIWHGKKSIEAVPGELLIPDTAKHINDCTNMILTASKLKG